MQKRDSMNTGKVEPCDVCGGVGSEEKIVSCFRCQKARQHVYCLQVCLVTVPEIWFCEECRSGEGLQTPKPEASTSQVVSGEAIKLSLAAQKLKLSSLNGKHWYVCEEEPIAFLVPANKVKTSNTRVMNPAKFTSSPSMYALPITTRGIFHADVHSKGLDIREINLKSFPKCEMYNSLGATWCGSFEIINLGSSCKFYDGFHAYLPRKVHCKALELSKQMPGVLLCSLLPRSHIYPVLFQNDSPNMDDISLIFFPGNFQRSKEKYVSLLGIIEMQDLVLKSCIDGFELLIFSSKSLNANSLEFKSGSFLWGLYRNVKGNPAVSLLTHDMISQPKVESCNVRNEIKWCLSGVKKEPYHHPDVPPGFPPQAADATAAR